MASEEQSQSSRFLWKRNLKYDLSLLAEVNSRNPFASNNQKPVWTDIARILQDGDLKMKVTDRSCRERVTELLKIFRKGELASIRTSGASEEELSELKVLLINVAKLQEAKPTKQLQSLYSRKDRNDGEAIRKRALEGVDNPFQREQILEELAISECDESVPFDNEGDPTASAPTTSAPAKSGKRKHDEQDDLDDFEFGPNYGKPTGPKKEMIRYLETKSERELQLRKAELRIREKEAESKAKEIEMMREAKQKDHEIERMKAEADIEDRKKMMDLLVKIATEKKQ